MAGELSLTAEDVLDPHPHPRLLAVGRLTPLAQRPVAIGPTVDPISIPFGSKRPADRLAAIGTVGVHILVRVAFVEQLIQDLAVVRGRVSDFVLTDDLVFRVGVDVVLVAKVILLPA